MSSAETTVVIRHGDQIVDGFRMLRIDDKSAHVKIPSINHYNKLLDRN